MSVTNQEGNGKSDIQNKMDSDPRTVIKVYNEKAGPASWFEVSKEHYYGVLFNTPKYVELTPAQEKEFAVPKDIPPPGKQKPVAGEDAAFMGTIKKLSKT
jgi:hypothetical protein